MYNNTAASSTYKNISASAGVEYTCTTDPVFSGSGNISGNPLFANPGASDYTLRASSPCINKGSNQAWMDGAKDLALALKNGELWVLFRENSDEDGKAMMATAVLPPGGACKGPVAVTGWIGQRCLGAWNVLPG